MLPDAELFVYGAYPTAAVQRLDDKQSGFHVCGHAPSLEVLANARVLLAPLRYGAGIKGKIVDAWRYGLPVVSTPMGAEGMHGAHARTGGGDDRGDGGASGNLDHTWGGIIAEGDEAFAAAAVELASDAVAWRRAQADGRRLLGQLYGREENLGSIHQAVRLVRSRLAERRLSDYHGAMLWQQTARSTEFFSRWIELKEAVSGKRGDGGGG